MTEMNRQQRRLQAKMQRRHITNREDSRYVPKPVDEWEQFDSIERMFQKLRHGEIEWDGTHYVIMGLHGKHYAILPALEGWIEYWAEVAKRFNVSEYDDGPLRRLAKSLEYDKPLTEQQVEAAYAVVEQQRAMFRKFPRKDIASIAVEVTQRIRMTDEIRELATGRTAA
jgi:hypothetical protein